MNVESVSSIFRNIEQSSPVEIRQCTIDFPETGIQFNYSEAAIWESPPVYNPPLSILERNKWMKAVGEVIYRQRKNIGFVPLLPGLMGFDPYQDHGNLPSLKRDRIEKLKVAARLSEDVLATEMAGILGLGAGLTPSGDDLISGLLLAFNRYPNLLKTTFDLPRFNSTIVELAYQKTSLLSANLIECAALGQVDERLHLALDGMMTGALAPQRCAEHLLSWGNSSGADAFIGMVLAAYPQPEGNNRPTGE